MNHFSAWHYSLSDFTEFQVLELEDYYVIGCYFIDDDRPHHDQMLILEDALGVDIQFSTYDEADEHLDRILEHIAHHA
jgi:hypothetical protein